MKGAQFVREARRRAGLTQAELGSRAGTTQSAIARIESGRVAPTFERIVDLVRVCGFDLDVRLVPYDDSNWILALQDAELTPSERVRQMLAFQRLADAARSAVIAATAARQSKEERAG
jgi:transcriptional regulator with XRE-family HTH domain